MATVNLGRIKPVFRGAFNNSTAYVIDDIVTSGNETFIAIAATQGNATTDASKWTKLAAKGADGTDVAATLANKEIAFKTNAGALDGISIGNAGEFLKVNSGATGYEFGAVSTNHTGVALIEYIMTSGFNDLQSVAGFTTSTNTILPFNTVQDPYNILGTTGSNVFQVNTSGVYLFNVTWSAHNLVHYVHPYLYNDTDSKYAEIPNSGFTGVDANKGGAPGPGYVQSSDPSNPGAGVFYYLETSHNYSVRVSTENGGNGLGSSLSQLQAQHTIGGVVRRLAPLRIELTKMGSV